LLVGLALRPAPLAPEPMAQLLKAPQAIAPDGSKLAEPPLAQVRFRVDSVPRGAAVSIDGRAAGVTPLTVELPANAQGEAMAEFHFALDGYQPISVSAGGHGPEVVLRQELQPAPRGRTRPAHASESL
jgi:hypothetical protein